MTYNNNIIMGFVLKLKPMGQLNANCFILHIYYHIENYIVSSIITLQFFFIM